MAGGSSAPSLTGIGTRSRSFPSSSFSCKRLTVQTYLTDEIKEQDNDLLSNGNELELVREREYTEQLEHGHSWPQVLVVGRHGAVGNVVMGRNTAQFGAVETTRGALVLDQVAFLQESGRSVDNVGSLLHETEIVLLVVDADAVQSG